MYDPSYKMIFNNFISSFVLLFLLHKNYITVSSSDAANIGTTRVAVVTGANKGIGNAIVRKLCDKFDGDVILTSRDVGRGLVAVEQLNKKGCYPKYHQLDIDDEVSILIFRDYLKENYGGLDVLVNNAGISIPWTVNGSDELFAEQTSKVVNTNFFGTRRNSHILFPLLRPHARVVNLSSMLGHLIMIDGKDQAAVDLRAKLASNELTDDQLVQIMRQFVESVKRGDYIQYGWPKDKKYLSYIASKIGVSALSRIQQRHFDPDPREDLIVNHVHPGNVLTDMTKGLVGVVPLVPVEQGAVTPTWLALLPPNVTEPKGAYVWSNKQIVDWVNGPAPPFY